ncbi:MAG: serine--tRNA ligase [Chloroflexi bacterium]|nr:serine--tRNA ligase [Chloroflexota bacterium]
MFDLRLIREQPDRVREMLRKRGDDPTRVDAILAVDEERRTSLAELEGLRAQRNTASKEIGRTLAPHASAGVKDEAEREARKAQVREINTRIDVLDKIVNAADTRLNDLVAVMPNIPDDDVPFGIDDSENVVLRTIGEPRQFDFEPVPHWDLGPALGIIDFERGIKLAGSRFYVLTGAGARLQRAVIQWMLDTHLAQGYREYYLPFMVKEQVVFAAGQLPKFRDNLYHDIERDAWMVPTAEVPLTSLHADEILDAKKLPLNYVAYTPCFRKEPMSAGKDVRGIKRGFQFDKVEMYKFCLPEDSQAELETLRENAEEICKLLEIPYRVKILCTGDIGFGARKTYDLEMWAPAQKEWLEVSSCSNVGDFQARRANVRFRREAGAKTEFVHTLNGSGLALPRTMIAIMENYQQKDGSIVVPDVLQPYVKMDVIK